MKKLIAIIIILLIIFVGMYIYRKQEIKSKNVTVEEVTRYRDISRKNIYVERDNY